MRAKALVYDLDDTLYAEKTFVFSGYRALADAFAPQLQPPFDIYERLCQIYDTPDRSRALNRLLADCGAEESPDLIAEMIRTYREHRPAITLLPEAERSLNWARDIVRTGLISDGFLVAQQGKVDALGLAGRIDHIVLTDQWGREFWKPHERAYREVAEALEAPHPACVYVADNRGKDFVAPNRLGWTSVFINRPGAVHADILPPEGGAPQFTIQSLDELPDLIAQ